MTDYDTYGTSSHTASELVRLVGGRLGLAFTEHDSYFRGIYHRADSPHGQIEIQPNPISRRRRRRRPLRHRTPDGSGAVADYYPSTHPRLAGTTGHRRRARPPEERVMVNG
ncbi:hypothetical protein OHU25_40590 [Streptomyces sp. NBC_00117]|uniref:hypothetical protein n=1 Tax=Streptomyces TaxID=1883 RepID=UPI002E2662DE